MRPIAIAHLPGTDAEPESGFDAHLVESLARSELSALFVTFGSSHRGSVNVDSLPV